MRAPNKLALQEMTLVVSPGRSMFSGFAHLVHLRPVCALFFVSLLWGLSSTAQTTQYNGIELPAAWPPTGPVSQAYKVPGYLTNPPTVIPIDVGRQLFVDSFLIDQTSLTQHAHRPAMYANNPVLGPGGSDVKGLAFPYSDGVWYDPADHLFKMWYLGGYGNMICYAYSTDGKNWIKPALPDAVLPGTNMVLQIGGQRDSDTVWMDLDDPDPSRKFKAFALSSAPIMNIYFSPDGIHWRGPQMQPIDSLSDRTTVFKNPFRKVWVDSARMIATLPATPSVFSSRPSRVRFYSESSDLINWNPTNPASAFWIGPDEKDPAYAGQGGALPELYNLDAVAYESVMVGLFSWFNPGPSFGAYGPGPNLVELGVGFSRDGFNWVRPTRGGGPNAFIAATNTGGTWNAYNTQSAGGGFLVVGDELWFYFSGRTLRKPASGIASTGLAVLRRDGFYSMDANAAEGILTTRTVSFSGKYLFVNVKDPQGSLQAEITDANGNVIAPFTKQNSVALSVDKTLQEVTWSGVSDLASISNRPVKIRFYLTNGELYSFWVSPDSNGSSHGYVAAGGPGFTGSTDTVGSSSGIPATPPPVVPAGTPALGISPLSLSLSATVGSKTSTPQSINIGNSGSGVLNWNATVSQPWIRLSSLSGTGTSFLTVTAIPGALTSGSYSGTVTVSAAAANPSVQTVNVSLKINNATIPPPVPPAVPTPVPPVSGPPVSTSGLAGYWPLDSATIPAGQVLDQSPQHLNGTVNGGVASIEGVINQGLSFDGRSAYIAFPGEPSTELTGNLTLAVWVKTLNKSRNEAVISHYAAGGAETGYIMRTDAGGHVEVRIGGFNTPNGAATLIDSGKLINDGQWHHTVAVLTLGHGVDFYIDGTLSSTQPLNIGSHGGDSRLQIGLNPWTPYGNYFTGSLDDVRIFNRVLSSTEIAALFALGNIGVVATPLIAPAAGVYTSTVTVSVSSPTSGSSIHYTTDGSEPTTGSPLYAQAITVNNTSVVKAKAVRTGMRDSGTASSSFTIGSRTPPPSKGPVGHWTFDNADLTGTQVNDRSGNNLSGTLVGGVTSTSGVINQAFHFDGITGRVEFPEDKLTDLTNDITLAAWIKTSNKSRVEAIISRYAAGGSETGYLFRTDASGHLEMKIGGMNSPGGTTTMVDTGKTINDGQWHHVAAVVTLGQGVGFYIDGLSTSHETDNITSHAGGSALRIGSNGWTDYGNHFTGSIDDVNIYNHALSASQIAALANVQVPVDNTPPSLSASPANLSFTATVGAGNPSSQAVAISNSGGGSLGWTASASQTWITLSSASGTAPQALQVGVNNNLAAGNYSGTVTISAPAGTPSSKAVNVSFVVSKATPPPVTPPPVTTPPVTTPPVTTPPVTTPPVTNGAQHYVASNGSSSGDGSIARPWDIQTAFNHPSSVKPGDTIWLRGGTYGDSNSIFASHLAGSANVPIIVRQYPGERATINGGINTNAPYTWYWGFEVMNTNTARVTGNARPECVDAYPGSTGVKFINLTLHDCMQGIGFWIGAINTEAYGNVIYFNGQQGPSRGMGHGTYTQNETGTKLLAENIVFSNFDINMQFYGSGNSFVKGIDMDGNASFNAGDLAGNPVDNIIFAVGSGLDNISVKNSYTYHTPSLNQGYSRLGWQFGGGNGTLLATGNYWIGGQQALQLWGWQHATFTNNVSYSAGSTVLLMNTLGAPSSQYVFDQNKYYGSGIFNFQGQNQGFSGWKSLAQVDAHSQFTAGRPTGVWAFVRPNKYESGRANIIIYNWDMTASVQVDVSSALKAGDSYVVRDAQNYFGAPVATGTYTGAPIAIPMQGLSVAQPVGHVPVPAVHTSAEFGAFVLIKQ